MELRVYDRELNFLGIIENFTSFIWNRSYFSCGSFELHLPIQDASLRLMVDSNIIYKKGFIEAATIEDVSLDLSNKKNEMVVKGRFLSSYLDRRLIKGVFTFKGTAVEAYRQLLAKCDAIPLLEFRETRESSIQLDFQVTYKNLMNTMNKVAQVSNVGYRIVPDFVNKKLYFETYEGVDHSGGQRENTIVTFTESYDNLDQVSYKYNSQALKTKLFVQATYSEQPPETTTGEDGSSEVTTAASTEKVITLVVGGGEGLDLREAFMEASVEQTDGMSEAQFRQALLDYGINELSALGVSESFESTINPNGNFKYLQHYDLGDIVTINKKSWGLKSDLRLTEIQEVYEHEVSVINPTFGSPLPTVVDWSNE